MAYNSGVQLSGLAGIVGAAVGGYLGYNHAAEVGMDPVQGGLILGGAGLVLGSAGAFMLKSAMQFVIYIIMLGVIAYFFQHQIKALTGVNPAQAVIDVLQDIGIPVGDIPGADKFVKPEPAPAPETPAPAPQ
jgi:hypothetical protein